MPGDASLGRYLMESLSALGQLLDSSDRSEQLVGGHLQDLLMVMELTHLTRTQLDVSQRLHNIAAQ